MIVAAVDRTDRAETVIEEATKLGAAFDEEIHLVHVMTRSEFVQRQRDEYEEDGQGVDPDEIRAIAAEVARERISGDSPHQSVGLVGKPEEEIVKYADRENASYVVVSSNKRSPTGKALFGSVSQSVLLNADCPVVSLVN
jgi:nucleotide-binding universal stress UspA family protein